MLLGAYPDWGGGVIQDLAWVTACHHNRERIEEVERTASEDDRFAWGFFGYDFPEFGAAASTIFQTIPYLLREVLGNPFRPPPPLPPAVLAWNDRTIPRLGAAIYEERRMAEGTLDKSRLAVLADALLNAGCEDDDLIQHCRSEGPHVRGCWAVDLCLSRN